MSATTKPSSGWNRSNSTPKPAPKKPSAFKGVLAGVLIVAALGAVCWFMFANEGTGAPKVEKRRERVKAEVRSDKPKETSQAAVSTTPGVKPSAKDKVIAKAADAEAPAPAVQPEPEKPKAKRVFDNSTDQVIAMVMTSSQNGASMPPLPGIGERDNKEFMKSLKKPIVINDDDPENIKAVKQLVQQTREEIVQLMEENPNMAFTDILQEHRKVHNENIDIKAQTTKELQKIIDEGDIEGAKKFRTTMNFALQQMGISEITTPITEEEKAEAEAAEENEN